MSPQMIRVRMRIVGDCIRALDRLVTATTAEEALASVQGVRAGLDQMEAALGPRETPVSRPTLDRTTEQGLQVFSLADGFQKWAGPDFETTVTAAIKQWGIDDDAVLAQHARGAANREPQDLEQAIDLDRNEVKVHHPTEPPHTITMRMYLRRLIAGGWTFPCYIAGHEE